MHGPGLEAGSILAGLIITFVDRERRFSFVSTFDEDADAAFLMQCIQNTCSLLWIQHGSPVHLIQNLIVRFEGNAIGECFSKGRSFMEGGVPFSFAVLA